ncbi:YetF domain-containing protein, partial [Bacillus pumilus]|uniref:YetF domain-containing protein n=1 Tax=Bacillus pumilus TaxID=1408 RepID=UPI0021B4B38E
MLERCGKVGVVEKEKKGRDGAVEVGLIGDGVVEDDEVKEIKQNEEWLKDELMKRGYD